MAQLDITAVNIADVADSIGVRRFTDAMTSRLHVKRKEGRGGWNNPAECKIDDLRESLMRHAEKGEWVNVGNYAMMIWNREHPDGT